MALKSRELVAEEFAAKGYELQGEYLGALKPVLVKDTRCGHTFIVKSASDITRGRGISCKVCSPSRRGLDAMAIGREIESFGVKLLEKYVNFKTNILVEYPDCLHTYRINPGHFLYDNIGKTCQICSNLGSIKNRFLSRLLDLNLELKTEYTTTQSAVSVLAPCGHTYSIIPNNLICNGTGEICRECVPLGTVSQVELELLAFIEDNYSGWIECNDRSLIKPLELDILLPDLGIAIEFNGIYWHKEESVGINYHKNKTSMVEDIGFRLIHINEDEWRLKQDIVKSRLLSILGRSNKIYARLCEIKEIAYPSKFLIDNHIQGSGSITKYNYGLYYREELVAVMTFSKPRFSSSQDYELVRYCSKINTTVVGGASRLLKYFRNSNSGSILSYSDKRWSIGDLYCKLGFTKSHTSSPNYRYYKNFSSLSRYQCQKHLLKDRFPENYSDALSEAEILGKSGYLRVFDCGNDVWTLT